MDYQGLYLYYRKGLHPYGLMPIKEFLACRSVDEVVVFGYSPKQADIANVHRMLSEKGLPTELGPEILALAQYKEQGNMRVAHDPLHTESRAALRHYMDECWKTMLRYYILLDVTTGDDRYDRSPTCREGWS